MFFILHERQNFKSSKKNYKRLFIKEAASKVATTEFLSKIPNRKKIYNEQFTLFEAKISLDEIIRSINSQTNNKLPGNDGLTAKFCKHLSNELASSCPFMTSYF